mmetsp:Transcript_1516/g.2129  ORF Transcript_1516/g.2129 Transcript_1516/m.2129 type:complete len:555 (+) Transcript_1516:82-1746(+)
MKLQITNCKTALFLLAASRQHAHALGTGGHDVCSNSRSILETNVDVVIIGAGMAGLAAAHKLEAHGVKFVLLEGRDQVGGRIRKKENFGSGVTIEDGANWILSGEDNPIFQLANKYGLNYSTCDFGNAETFFKNGTRVSDEYNREAYKRFNSAKQCLFDYGEEFNRQEGNHDEGVDVGSRAIMEQCGWSPEDEVDRVVEWMGLDFGAASPDHVSLYTVPDDSFTDFTPENWLGDWNFVVDDRGFEHIAVEYAAELKTSPQLAKEVYLVEWDDIRDDAELSPGKVSAFDYVTEACYRYNAKKVISTVSVGVLENRPDLFSPNLPTAKMDSNPFKMGVFCKVYFQFPEKFWGDKEVINMAVSDRNQGKCNVWYNLDLFKPGSNILFCMITDEIVGEMGIDSDFFYLDESMLDGILEPLRNIYGSAYVSPLAQYYPNWPNDAWTYGSFEKWQLGRKLSEYEIFAAPLENKKGMNVVHFSGSATCRRYDGWVHGAFFSGERTANYVLEELGVQVGDDIWSACDWEDGWDDEEDDWEDDWDGVEEEESKSDDVESTMAV